MKIKTIEDSDVTEVADLKFPEKDGNHVVQQLLIRFLRSN